MSDDRTPYVPPQPKPADDRLPNGTMVGEYEITGQIGEGGMGVVYAVVHPIIGKRAAVKVVRGELSTRTDGIQRFIQEAQAVNQIAHPNIVDIFSLGTMPDGRPYFVMELLDGESLASRLRKRSVSSEEAVRILEQVCGTLEATHAQEIVHRDLKPDNIFLHKRTGSTEEVVKLLDFGIAKLNRADAEPVKLTVVGSTMGTPQYLSPELARGLTVDPSSDIYSLGVIAFELFTGRLPFVCETAIDYVMAHVGTPPPKPSALRPELPKAVDDLVLSMLEKDPRRRPSAAEVRRKLALVVLGHARISSSNLAVSSAQLGSLPTAPGTPSPSAQPIVPLTSPISGIPARSTPSPRSASGSSPSVGSGSGLGRGSGAPPSRGPYRAKGSHIVMAARWVDERLGAGTFKELVQHHGAPWNGLLLEGTWFDVDPLDEALTIVGSKLGRSVEDITQEITRLNALEDLTTMYRFFLRVAAPQRLMTFTPRLWSTYVEFGEAKALVNEPGHYVGECVGIPERLLAWSSGAWRGFVPTAIEVAGGKDVRGIIKNVRPTGVSDLFRLECEITYKK